MGNYKIWFVLLFLFNLSHFSFSQNDSTKRILTFKGSVSATNNGFSIGLDEGTTRQTDFVALRAHFSNIPLSKKLFLQFNPQIFYLKTDERDGTYLTSILTLAKKNFPISISSIMNKGIQTNIISKDFDWNVSLVYSFHKKFVREK